MSTSDNSSYATAESDSSFCSLDDNLPTIRDYLSAQILTYSRNFNACHINAQSIPSHHADAMEAFELDCLHAVLISESWLKPSLPSAYFPIKDYVLIRNDRTGKRGGGVAIYLKSHLKFKTILQSPSTYCSGPEYLFIEIDFGVKLLLGVVYCPPCIDYISKLEAVFENLTADYSSLLIMGDFNTCLLNTNQRSTRFRNIVESVNLNFLPLLPTHHTSSSDTLLDLILTSDTSLVACHGQIPAPAFSHHDLIYTSLRIKSPKPKPVILKQRNFSRINLTKLIQDADELNWSYVDTLDNIDEKVEFLNKNIITLFDKHAPIRSIKVKHPPSPWMNDMIRRAMTRRDRAFRKFKRDRTTDNWNTFKKLRNRCNQLIRNAKRRHIFEQIQLATPSGIWAFLRSLGLGKQKNMNTKIPLDLNTLNIHFSTNASIPAQVKDNTLSQINLLPIPMSNPFNFSCVSHDMVKKIFNSLKSKAVGNDNIGRVMLVYLIDQILPTITHIINYSLNTSVFPNEWRKAHILPLPKVSNPSLPNDFRPISILPFLSKVIESVALKQLTQYLKDECLLNPLQSGFRAGHSTTTALVKVTEDIRHAMNNSLVTILVLIDFSNAFNAVDHDLILAALSRLNFSPPSVNWFSSYLKGRCQLIRNGEDRSDWHNIDAGVPQGGILSPLLFSLFINLLSSNLISNYHFYADDLQLYYSTSTDNLSHAINVLNDDLISLYNWSESYGIKVNPNKCQAIIVGSSRQLTKFDILKLPSLFYNNAAIPFSPSVKDLGVIIDSNLSWTAHIQEVSRKFYSSLHPILRLKNFLPHQTKISLVNTLLLPIIFYADTCFLDLSEDLLNKLDRLLNTCIRFIFNLRKYDHVSKYRTKLNWLPIRERRSIRILCLLFNILNDPNAPEYLKQHFTLFSDCHDRQLRSSQNLTLKMPTHRTSFLENSFAVEAVRLWNALPEVIRKSTNIVMFKRLTQNYFLKKVYPQ